MDFCIKKWSEILKDVKFVAQSFSRKMFQFMLTLHRYFDEETPIRLWEIKLYKQREKNVQSQRTFNLRER